VVSRRDVWPTWYRIGLAALLAAALAIRFTHIDFGLPELYHPDEGRKARVIEQVLAGEPHTYLNHPGLLINSVVLLCAIWRRFVAALDSTSIILAGRMLVALVGSLTVLPTAALARTLFGGAAGLFAGAAIAFSPLHTLHSRYLKEDVYLTFWVVVGLWALARWLDQPPARRATPESHRLVVAALGSAGLAMGSKYVGIVAVLFTVEVWRRASGASWRRALAAVATASVLPVLVTPQLFTGLVQGRTGMYSLGWEMRHGMLGGYDRLTLYFFEWPDLGAYFLLHGLGWGMSWPIVLLSIVAIVVAWRHRRADPALLVVAAAAVVWYAVAEATPLKRGGDVERYVVPCAPLLAALAAGWMTRWRRPGRAGSGASVAAGWGQITTIAIGLGLLLIPLLHTLFLTAGIADDTRRQAARWLEQHGPTPPYELAYLGDREYHLDGAALGGVTMTRLRGRGSTDRDRAAVDRSAVLVFSELDSRRFEDFPRKSRQQLAAYDRLRADFPVVVMFRKPYYLKGGFHNPDIELRLRAGTGRPLVERVP
jgi:hypothetical protein